jgi:CRISPR-associated exonuclease Cas4
MVYSDDEMVPLSALQHDVFCRRQCALIHLENAWTENVLTAEGRAMHDRVDASVHESRRDVRLATTLRLVSHRLGVAGVADMVEFRRVDDPAAPGAVLPGVAGRWMPFPVEYKHGKPNGRNADEAQLCAQAMCLEEMLGVEIPSGALFYGKTRHRLDVTFDAALRALTERAAADVHELLARGVLPEPEYGKWCESCSLVEDCRPKAHGRSARAWLEREMEAVP